jgi:hypothetical protein
MNVLRERLRETAPDLYYSLERSWQIAYENWLPALASRCDSYNSYPHLRNLESYLQQIISELEKQKRSGLASFTPLEMYVLLASILFHDIGMITASKKSEHAKESAAIVQERFEALGIPSIEIATLIKNMCEFHGLGSKRDIQRASGHLGTVTIDPHGKIRQLEMASMLYLLDHMDGAYTRVIPAFIKAAKRLDPVGAFRRVVKSVYFDYQAQMICTELGTFDEEALNKEQYKKRIQNLEVRLEDMDRMESLLQDFREDEFSCVDGEYWVLKKAALDEKMKITIQPQPDIIHIIHKKWFKWTMVEDCLLRLPLRVVKKQQQIEWSNTTLLAMIMKDYSSNRKALNDIKENLAKIGLFIKDWLMSYEEHLFEDSGQEVYEPIFHKDYLHDTAKRMWELSTQVFGSSFFTFENLGASIREPNIEKVKMAVKRLAVLSKNRDKESNNERIWAGNKHWKWLTEEEEKNLCCSGMSLGELNVIINRIDDLNVTH